MWPYYPELLETPVPRYTSFPTAAEFRDGLAEGTVDRAMEEHRGDVSLYVHIPFCEKICWYCGCNTGAANRTGRVASYLEALHREIALVSARLHSDTRVTRIAFGGGSPNAISPIDFVRLVDIITVQFGASDPVISVEIDPRTFEPEWSTVLAGTRVTKASLGVQTLEPHLQQAIGRVQPADTIRRAVDLLRDAGVDSLNFDLMYGLPGQTIADLEVTLRESVAMGADRIALFGYAHVPHLIPRQRKIVADDLPGQHLRFDMAQCGFDLLTSEGYDPVGFDHFARPSDPLARAAADGSLRRNFQGFTDDPAQVLIGLGATAISQFPSLLAQNEKNAGRYRMMLSQARLTATRGIIRSASDIVLGGIIERLLCAGWAEIPADVLRDARPALQPFIERGLASLDGSRLTIAAEGLPYSRTIAAQFDPYRQDSLRRFSSAV